MTKPNIIALVSSSLLLLMSPLRSSAAETFSTADSQEVQALFLRQAAAENAHDLAGIDGVLARATPGQSEPVTFIARAYRFLGTGRRYGSFPRYVFSDLEVRARSGGNADRSDQRGCGAYLCPDKDHSGCRRATGYPVSVLRR